VTETFIELSARQEHIGPAPPQAVQAECSAIVRQNEQADQNVLAEPVEKRAGCDRHGVSQRPEAEMITESEDLIHMLARSEGHVRAHASHSFEIVSRQERRKLSERMTEQAAELPRPLKVCPCPVIARYALVPEMKLNDLFAWQKLGPVGKRDRMIEPTQLDAKYAIWIRGIFDEAQTSTEPRVQFENKPRQPARSR
jgi:hypothetical protein